MRIFLLGLLVIFLIGCGGSSGGNSSSAGSSSGTDNSSGAESKPTITSSASITLNENQVINYQISTTDNVSIKPNSYSLSGTDASYFTINSETGLITSKASGDYESKPTYEITVSVRDRSDNEISLAISITLKNLDDINPVITSANTITLYENRTIYYQMTATDNVSIKANSYTLSGTDSNYFTINSNTGLISSIVKGDYETKASYTFTVSVSDISDNETSLDVSIILKNITDEENPRITSVNTVNLDENRTIYYQITATDNISIKPNSFTLSGADASYFAVNSKTGLINSKENGDYETKSIYAITVGVSDTSDIKSTLAVTITLNNLDDSSPIFSSANSLSLNENLTINYQISATDNISIKPNSFTLSGADASYFTIDTRTGFVSSKIKGDYETKSNYAITVGVSDTSDNASSLAIAITLINVDESNPLITSENTMALNENLAINYQITATDNIGIKPNSFTLFGADASYFTINTGTGLISSKVNGDYETKSSYAITVGVSDTNDNESSLAVTITLNNLDDSSPVITSANTISLNENLPINYQITATDNIGIKPNSFTLSGADASYFVLNTGTGLVSSKVKGDFETKAHYSISVGVIDTSDNKVSLAVTITLINLDDINPLITSEDLLVLNENKIINYQITATDNVGIKPNSFTLLGADASYFTINTETGLISSKVNGDYETKSSYAITLRVSDTSDNESSLAVTITLNNLDDSSPVITSVNAISLDENMAINYQITSTDNIGIKPNSFTLFGADASYFTINTGTGLISSKVNGDYETKSSYAITVGVSDTNDNESSLAVTITLNNLDDSSPVITSANTISLNENLPINYQITATDNIGIKPDSFSLSGADVSYFTINTGTGLISSKVNGDYEIKSTYAITVGVTDTSDNESSLALAIALTDIDESACNYTTWNVNEHCNENNISKLVVDRDLLITMINADNDVTTVYTGQITDMSYLFKDKDTFNQDISNWNTSNVTNMSFMFTSTKVFNQNIGQWDTGKVINMDSMFRAAIIFNQDIGQWDTSKVTNMSSMFAVAYAFNKDISQWDTSRVTNMSLMFSSSKVFNQDIGQWDTSEVTNMRFMFSSASIFNQNIGQWNTGKVTNMWFMFSSASRFNKDIGQWDTSNVSNMSRMFYNASAFNKDISLWDISSVTDISYMFENAKRFNQNVSLWDTSKVIYIAGIFQGATYFDQDIGRWDISKVTNLSNVFKEATFFNQSLSQWDTSNVTDMRSMFEQARNFNKNIGQWDTSNVTNMNSMFLVAGDFNQNIDQWNTSKVTDMASMFQGAWSFNQIIGSWDTSEVTDMSFMFNYAKAFNQEIGHWNISKVTKMPSMFFDAYAFNQEIGQWDTSKITNMGRMFDGASAFNRPIGQWNTSNVRYMNRMFYAATAFNQDIHNWNIAKVARRAGVFGGSNNINSSYMPTGLCTPITKCVLR